ncbi:hypothetical protein C8Q76DRAFT_792718 [Earliella scabrosa]|nr:hypothetical protein C8Q76DRAFT_792718 [Earliella scabrosa]
MNYSDPALTLDLFKHLDRGGSIGPGYLGVIVSTLIYGITCTQSFQYFRNPKSRSDAWFVRLFVASIWLLDTVHQIMVTHAYYGYLVTNWGNLGGVVKLVWSLWAGLFVNCCVFMLIRCFFLWRIWILSHNRFIVTTLALVAFSRLVTSLVYSGIISRHGLISEAEAAPKTIGIGSMVLEVMTTVLYTSTLVFYLVRSRSGIAQSDSIMTRVITLVISTSMLSVFISIGQLVACIISTPTKLYLIFFEFILETVDANAALTSLNSREFLRGRCPSDGPTAYVLNSPPTRSNNTHNPHMNMHSTASYDDSMGISVTVDKSTFVV